MATDSTDRQEKCTKQFVLTAEKKPKCRSNQHKEDLFTAGNASTSTNRDIESLSLLRRSLFEYNLYPGADAPPIFLSITP